MNTAGVVANREFLLLSDFDQTLSFKDSGLALGETTAIANFHNHVRKLANTHLTQQGGELAYLLLHGRWQLQCALCCM